MNNHCEQKISSVKQLHFTCLKKTFKQNICEMQATQLLTKCKEAQRLSLSVFQGHSPQLFML